MEEQNLPMIGVIGGVGPYAGLDFVRNLFNHTRAVKDQDHLNCLLVSCPSIIPDRTGFLLNGGENPALGLYESARRLHAAGARYAAVTCNTAHSERIFAPFREMVEKSLPELKLINMIETCVNHVKTLPRTSRIGLLATMGTYKSGVYHEYFTGKDGLTLIEPEDKGKENIHEAIYNTAFGIKAHPHNIKSEAKDLLIHEIFRLAERGAEAVILGCTELPLAVKQEDSSIPVIDPGLLTARALITLTAPGKLLD